MKNIIFGVLAFVALVVVIWRWEIVTVEVPEIHFTTEPLHFEPSTVRIVNKTIFGLISWRDAQLSIKNTDNSTGTFRINFVFDNDIEMRSITKSVELFPNEEKEITTHIPLKGQINVEVNVIPQNKFIPVKTMVKKTVSVWSWATRYR